MLEFGPLVVVVFGETGPGRFRNLLQYEHDRLRVRFDRSIVGEVL